MNKIKYLISIILPVWALLSLNSCNELPTELGYPLLYDTVMVKAVSTLDNPFITGSKIINFHKGILNSSGILIGKYAGMESAAFIRCGDLPDSLTYMTPDRIISSIFTLKAKRWAMGDSDESFSLKAYKVKKLWTIKTNWDSMFTAPADYIDYSKTVGVFNGIVPLQDSIYNVNFDLDKDLAAEWLKYGSDTAKYINLGIALLPGENSKQIRRFAGQFLGNTSDTLYYNELTVIYRNKLEQIDTITLHSAMDYTLTHAPQPTEEFVLQGNAQYATQLQFDLSSLPDNIAIHSASLEVQLDKEHSILSNFNTDSLRDQSISAVYLKNGADSVVVGDTLIPMLYGGVETNTYKTYTFKLFTYAIEYWMRYASKKGQIILTKSPTEKQYIALDKYVFFGINDPDPKKRPKLRIIYSRRPDYGKDVQKGGK